MTPRRASNHHRWLHHQIEDWQDHGLVDANLAAHLRARYPLKASGDGRGASWMTVILGIFGSVLIMGGVILLFAHNWYDLSRLTRTCLAVTPLLTFQVLAGWTLWRRPESAAWREGVGGGLTLAIGAAIALVAQTYQLGGDFGRFILVWTLLVLPVVHLLRSGTAFWCYLAGAVVHAGYGLSQNNASEAFYGLVLAAVPFALWVHRADAHRTLAHLCRQALAIAFWVGMPIAFDYRWTGAWLPFLSLCAGAMVLWDRPREGRIEHLGRHPFTLLGAMFTGILLLAFSYADTWQAYSRHAMLALPGDRPVVLGVLVLVLAGWIAGLVWRVRQGALWPCLLATPLPLLAFCGWGLPLGADGATVLMLATNALCLTLGVFAIVQAVREDRLGLLNFGLILAGGLLLLRFFDADLGFVFRGVGFIALGVAFLAANLLFVRNRRGRGAATFHPAQPLQS